MTETVRTRTDPAAFFDLPDHRGDAFQEQLVERAFAAVEQAWSEAYESGDDEDAVAYLEAFAVPLFRQLHGIGGSDVDLDYWSDKAEAEFSGELDDRPAFDIDVADADIPAFYEDVRQRFDRDRFDQLVGIYSGGIPVLYTASAYLDGDEVLLRYSHKERDDEEVMVTDEMEDRMDFKGSRVLLLDDFRHSGQTMRQVGKYILDRGAVEVKGLTYTLGEYVDLQYKPVWMEDIYTGWQEVELRPVADDSDDDILEELL